MNSRNADVQPQLLLDWIGLFGISSDDNLEDELIITFLEDLYTGVDYYYKITALVDGIKIFKDLIPRKKPEDHWSCIAHLNTGNMLKSSVIEEKKFKHSPRTGADNPLGPKF